MAVLLLADIDLTAKAFFCLCPTPASTIRSFSFSIQSAAKIKASKLQHVITVILSRERVNKYAAKLK